MTTMSPPTARRQFARRLREFRIDRGFKTARSLARALGIDENRYTRYERAEVEPDLVLIQRICETLRVTPNDLFGTGDEARGIETQHQARTMVVGFTDDTPTLRAEASPDPRVSRDTITWTLACAVAELQAKSEAPHVADGSPLATLQRAARLFADLERRPFAAVSEILLMPPVACATQGDAQRIGQLVEVFARTVN
jgi:transcriptional regulator with XRE-family HTH domain